MSNRLVVQIYGVKYPIITTEDPAYVKGLAQEIDAMVTELMRSGSMSVNQALLLANLHHLDRYRKADEGADNLRRQITEYAEDAAKARMELAEARKGQSKQGGKNDSRN